MIYKYRLYDDTLNSNQNSWRGRARDAKIEKLKCLINYFKRCIERRETSSTSWSGEENLIVFERKVLHSEELLFDWKSCDQVLLRLEAFNQGVIEDAEGLLQVDFANAFVGKYLMHQFKNSSN